MPGPPQCSSSGGPTTTTCTQPVSTILHSVYIVNLCLKWPSGLSTHTHTVHAQHSSMCLSIERGWGTESEYTFVIVRLY